MASKAQLNVVLVILLPLVVLGGAVALLHGHPFAVLEPRGVIAEQERNLIVVASLLSLLVVVPVFGLTIFIAYTYRAGNQAAKYRPDLEGSRALETIWWTLPSLLIATLAFMIWTSTHQLEPSTALASSQPAVKVQVVALDWKWLFIYPEEGIATVNSLTVPVGRPVSFELTADAPMNSFWIPQLGGQMYAMPGMVSHLHLEASQTGGYLGRSANLSGRGFAKMTFMTHAVMPAAYVQWVATTKQAPRSLSVADYAKLAQPSQDVPPTSYSRVSPEVFTRAVGMVMP